MINKILNILKEKEINTYLINTVSEESYELFFIKKNLDMKRLKHTLKYELTVYNDFLKNDVKMRGSATCQIYPDMTDDEISKKIADSYYASSFVTNPYYPLPSYEENTNYKASSYDINDAIKIMTDAIFTDKIDEKCFINSAEIFFIKKNTRIISSENVDVNYSSQHIEGEFVAQCTEPDDVETYQDFYYDTPDADSLRSLVNDTLKITMDRAKAIKISDTGKIKLILSGQYVSDLLSFYTSRASASMIYPKYSDFKLNEQVQGDNIKGDLLNIELIAKYPYSAEGICMKNLPLLENGVLKTIHGNSRFCHYLNTKPTGIYDCIKVNDGDTSIETLKSKRYLHVVNFSDFQMDALSGRFGGEFRLAYYFDGEKEIPVTSGSISGSIIELADNITLSSEHQKLKGYEGPLAISIENVSF